MDKTPVKAMTVAKYIPPGSLKFDLVISTLIFNEF